GTRGHGRGDRGRRRRYPLENRQLMNMSAMQNAQQEIIDEFGFYDDWTGRYQYLIDLGRKLPPLADKDRIDANKVDGCQSQVWIVVSGDANRMDLRAASDSAIVSGLVALLLRVYSGQSARDILDTDP